MIILDRICKKQREQLFMNWSLLIVFMLFMSSPHAGSKIVMQSSIFDAGTSIEGVNETLPAYFTFKNNGTSPLQIYKVIPACGCTKIVKYDSLVMPGKSGKIDAEINLKNFRPGPLSKVITVLSNADNDSTLRIAVKATVRSIIEISEPYITINGSDSARKSFTVLSKKGDISILGVSFKKDPYGNAKNPAAWQEDVPLVIRYQWMPVDSIRDDGYKVYRLTLFLPHIKESMLGFFRIQTNHPNKPEVFLRGTLLR